jgi:hypothetical protein
MIKQVDLFYVGFARQTFMMILYLAPYCLGCLARPTLQSIMSGMMQH